MKYPAIDIHTHVEFAGTMDVLKKRYTEEEIFNRFTSSVSGRQSAELNRGIVAGIRDALREPQKKIRDMDEKGMGCIFSPRPPSLSFMKLRRNWPLNWPDTTMTSYRRWSRNILTVSRR